MMPTVATGTRRARRKIVAGASPRIRTKRRGAVRGPSGASRFLGPSAVAARRRMSRAELILSVGRAGLSPPRVPPAGQRPPTRRYRAGRGAAVVRSGGSGVGPPGARPAERISGPAPLPLSPEGGPGPGGARAFETRAGAPGLDGGRRFHGSAGLKAGSPLCKAAAVRPPASVHVRGVGLTRASVPRSSAVVRRCPPAGLRGRLHGFAGGAPVRRVRVGCSPGGRRGR
jgi:hypothetical protein